MRIMHVCAANVQTWVWYVIYNGLRMRDNFGNGVMVILMAMEYVCLACVCIITLCVFTYERYRRLLAHIRVMCIMCYLSTHAAVCKYARSVRMFVQYCVNKLSHTPTLRNVVMFVRPMKFFYLYVHMNCMY
jgi:hypothetical protein